MPPEGARRGAALLALALSACVSQRTSTIVPALSGPGTSDAVEQVVRSALRADADGDPSADTLYTPGALVIANARVRLRTPRLAGVGYGGRITIASVSATMEGRFAWVLLDYRWVNVEANNIATGRATVVCQLVEGRWRIVHLHSSQPLPWES
ncbi:MAG TPA: nuclear transport factor 2 family protein [Gemmatimonadales bacterium]|jgi:hypothetical protein|nr:nuclear transport factor 2 family protein [Gemmatimonadales bacterium]